MNHPDVSYPKSANTPTSHLPFSPCVACGDLIFVSGQASVDSSGQIISDSFEGEFRRSVENLRNILESASSDLAHVIQVKCYVRDEADMAVYNQLYREYFTAPYPARSTITNCLGKALRFELDAIAVKRKG